MQTSCWSDLSFKACVPRFVTECTWTKWLDDEVDGRKVVDSSYEFELISDLRKIYDFCDMPSDIRCALKSNKETSSADSGQQVSCSSTDGLRCYHVDQTFPPRCLDYVIRLQCCQTVHYGCEPTTPETTTMSVSTTSPLVTTPSSTAVVTTPSKLC